MPSNSEYTKQAQELAEKLGIEVETNGLNNEKLANLVSDLKAKARDAELNTQADQNGAPPQTDEEAAKAAEEAKAQEEAEAQRLAEEQAAKAAEEEAEKLPPYSVAKGKALTTKRGIVSDGDEVTAEHLAGGQKALDAFVKSGHVVKA